jgi:hypothetical protein
LEIVVDEQTENDGGVVSGEESYERPNQLEAPMPSEPSANHEAGDRLDRALFHVRNGAGVWGTDGELGPVIAIVAEPAVMAITDIAVRNADVAGTGRLLPIGTVTSASPQRIDVDVDRHRFFSLPHFIVPYRSPNDAADRPSEAPAAIDVWLVHPGTFLFATHENVPPGFAAIHRGAHVFSVDGHHIGDVMLWNVDPATGTVASIVIGARRHHFQRDHLLVESSLIRSLEPNGVHLSLERSDLDDLPSAID